MECVVGQGAAVSQTESQVLMAGFLYAGCAKYKGWIMVE